MRYSKSVLMLWGLMAAAGCDKLLWTDGPAEPESEPPPNVVTCNGICVNAPPGTYTGPSEFWIGAQAAAPACPSYMHVQGFQGMITSPAPMVDLFARECRVTTAASCGDASLACVPFPAEDYHVCIHHVEESTCPSDYPFTRIVIRDDSGEPVTVCCVGGLSPG